MQAPGPSNVRFIPDEIRFLLSQLVSDMRGLITSALRVELYAGCESSSATRGDIILGAPRP
jgi:hypothetical protein